MLNWDTYKSGLGRIDVMLLKIGHHIMEQEIKTTGLFVDSFLTVIG